MRRPDLNRMKAERHPAVGYCRPEVMDFALLMERELRANDHKRGWKEDQSIDLARRVMEEAQELLEVTPHNQRLPEYYPFDPTKVAEEAADVANMAMMVADVCGCLRSSRTILKSSAT